jgi:hypothetical protein
MVPARCLRRPSCIGAAQCGPLWVAYTPPLLIPAAFARQLSRRISERPLSPAPPSPAFSPQWRTTLRLWHQRPPCTLHGYQLRAPSAQLWYPTRPSIPRLRGPPVRCCHTAHCCSGLQPRRGTTHAPPLDRTNATHGYSPKCFSWKAPGWTRPLRLPRRAPRRQRLRLRAQGPGQASGPSYTPSHSGQRKL